MGSPDPKARPTSHIHIVSQGTAFAVASDGPRSLTVTARTDDNGRCAANMGTYSLQLTCGETNGRELPGRRQPVEDFDLVAVDGGTG